MESDKKYKIVYCTPALYMAGGVERVLTLKANFFAEHFGYNITIVLTEGKDKPLFYPLSEKIKVINLNIGFEELWSCSFLKKIYVYLKKQRQFKKALTAELMCIHPDITISLLRREINFINEIQDGSRKIGEMHINRANYRNYDTEHANIIKRIFAKFWSHSLLSHLKKLDTLVVLTEKDREAWVELDNVVVIPDPLSLSPSSVSSLTEKRVISVARYSYEKGIDLLLKAWSIAEKQVLDWRLDVFGDGDRTAFEQLIDNLKIDRKRCQLHDRTNEVEKEYINSSLFVLSSRFEGFGMVILEAMACGLPVVSYDCPWGPSSIITNMEDGSLIENGNVQALADGVCELIENPELRKEFGKNARKNVLRYSRDNVMLQWVDLFESLFLEKGS